MKPTPAKPTAPSGSLPRRVRRPLRERILDAYTPGIGYHHLMDAVFPAAEYPRAFRYATGGGPPGCVLAFGRGLRDLGLYRSVDGKRVEGTPNALVSDGGSLTSELKPR